MKKRISYVLLLLSSLGCLEKKLDENPVPIRQVSWESRIQKFSSCQEIEEYIKSFQWGHAIPVMASEGQAATQSQVNGVQEGDLLQIHPEYFFFLRPGSIEIINRSSMTFHKSLAVKKTYWQNLLYHDQKLIHISQLGSETFLRIYDEAKNFQMVYQKYLIGAPIDFRLSETKLVLATRHSFANSSQVKDCSHIHQPNLQDGASTVSSVHVVDLEKSTFPEDSLSVMGAVDFFYMTTDELLLFTNHHGEYPHFRSISWKDGLKLNHAQLFEGRLKDRWSVHKKDTYLFLATTFQDERRNASNNKVQVFESRSNKSYRHLADSPDFGIREDIRAVRYLNDKAYIVTFEKTDPLFVLDLQDPKQIEILSELESPGFSTLLRELSTHLMGGLGYEAIEQVSFSFFAGLKFSLFDFSDELSPIEKSVLGWGDRGSYSEATSNPKALSISQEGSRIAFPAVIVKRDSEDPGFSGKGESLDFSGALVLELNGSELKEVARFTHAEWREPTCGKDSFFPMIWWSSENQSSDIQRIVEIDGRIYTFSRFGVMKHTLDYEIDGKLEFRNSKSLCSSYHAPVYGI